MRTHFTDLVEEQSAVMRQIELARLAARGSGKGALFISEQLGFQQFIGKSRTIHPHERAIGPIGVTVNEAGEYVFSHTRLTEDENGNIRLSNVPSDINDSQHPRIRSYESLPGICALLIQSLNFRARFGQ